MTGIEHLREFVRTFHGCPSDVCRYTLTSIADQIAREQADRADDIAESFRSEVSEAYEWVRGHGGIAYVKEEWNARNNLKRSLETAQAKVERQQRHIEFMQGKCHERLVRIAALNKTVAEMRPRLIPEGMEWLVEAWPRFKDDSPVRLLDDFDRYGEESGVSAVTMYVDGSFALNFRAYSKGERVNRPAVLAADGEPLEVGQTVWGTKGGSYHLTSVHNGEVFARHIGGSFGAEVESAGGSGLYRLRAEQLTHERPESWERLEEDATIAPAAYCHDRGLPCACDPDPDAATYVEAMARDLVRRARALAERDR